MSEHRQPAFDEDAVTVRVAAELADAIWDCMEARREKAQAFESTEDRYSWERRSESYWNAIERADKHLASILAKETT